MRDDKGEGRNEGKGAGGLALRHKLNSNYALLPVPKLKPT